jgi:glucosyl-3-phosphoglycerate phosphatase
LKWWEIEEIYDPKIRDTDLTDFGIQQAQALNAAIATLNPTLVIASPLRRSLQTAIGACGEHECVYHITPHLREHSYSICDIGHSPSFLSQQFPQFQTSFENLSPTWWCNTESQELYDHDSDYLNFTPEQYRESWQHLQDRVEQLLQLIDHKIQVDGHDTILLVGHAVLFFALTGKWVDNCQLIELNREEVRQRCACEGYVCQCGGGSSYLDA